MVYGLGRSRPLGRSRRASSAGAEMFVPLGCQRKAGELRSRCDGIEKQSFLKKSLFEVVNDFGLVSDANLPSCFDFDEKSTDFQSKVRSEKACNLGWILPSIFGLFWDDSGGQVGAMLGSPWPPWGPPQALQGIFRASPGPHEPPQGIPQTLQGLSRAWAALGPLGPSP